MQQIETSPHPRFTVIALAFLISSFFFFSLFFLLIKPAHAELGAPNVVPISDCSQVALRAPWNI